MDSLTHSYNKNANEGMSLRLVCTPNFSSKIPFNVDLDSENGLAPNMHQAII